MYSNEGIGGIGLDLNLDFENLYRKFNVLK